jgi:cytochrome P450
MPSCTLNSTTFWVADYPHSQTCRSFSTRVQYSTRCCGFTPPIPLLTREALCEETFQEKRIRKGSLIVVCPWLLHRHRKLWTKPDHFIPDRFMPGGERPASKFSYIPFSVDPRVCSGMAFGLTEAILCIATIAQAFVLRLNPGHRIEVACRLTLRPGDKLPMRLVARAPVQLPAGTTPGSECLLSDRPRSFMNPGVRCQSK